MREHKMAIDWKDHLGADAEKAFHLVRHEVAEIESAGADLDYKTFHLDLSAARSKSHLLDLIASTMAFPEYFGRNWDALLDLMSDLSWWPASGYVLIIDGARQFNDVATSDFSTFLEVVVDAVERMRANRIPLHVVLVGDAPKFDVETAVGVRSVCDHAS